MMKRKAFLKIACILIFAVSVQAEDIINTLAGYDEHSGWGAIGPEARSPSTGLFLGDHDIAWWFRNNSTPHCVTMVELPLMAYYQNFWPGRIADIMIWSDTEVPVFGHVPDQMLELVTIDMLPINDPDVCTAVFSGATVLDPNTYYWVALSVPGKEFVSWWQDEFADPGRGAWREDLGPGSIPGNS